MKVYSELERASLENLSTAPANPVDGLAYYDTTLKRVRVYRDGSWGDLVDATATITMTNKSIDADNNTISNLETDNLKVGVIEVDLAGTISSSNDTIPSAKAVKNYVNSVSAVNDTFATTILAAHATIRSSIHGVATVAGTEDVDASTTICKSYADTILASHATIRSSIHGVATVAGTADVDAATTVCKTYTDTVVSSHATVSSGVHGVTGSVVGTTDAQSISAKTISSSKFTDHVGLAVTTVGATPAAGFINLYAKGTSLFTKTEAGTETEVGSGAGGSSDNLVTNADAKTDTTGYIAYKDAAGTSPVDGAGGTPTLSISRTTTAGEILSGTASFKITKAAGDAQGEGISYDITVDEAHRGQPLQLSFDMEVLSGTYADGDMKMYVFDVTNTIMMECVPTTIGLAITGQSRKILAGFQPQYNCETARIIWHVASTSTIAYSLAMDNVKVWEPTKSNGAVVTDWAAYTPTLTGFGTPSGVSAFWKRDGSDLLIMANYTCGTNTATEARFSLPTGLVIGTLTGTTVVAGYLANNDSNAEPVVVNATAGNTYLRYGRTTVSGGLTPSNANAIFNNGITHSFQARVPILGWSSNMVLSSDAGNRQIGAIYKGNAGQSLTADVTDIPYSTKDFDPSGGWDGSKFTCPESGVYSISAYVHFNAAFNSAVGVYKSGSIFRYIGNGSGSATCVCIETKIPCVAGDTISLRSAANGTLTNALATNHWISILKLATPQTIGQVESVSVQYTGTDGASLSTSASIVKYQTKIRDTHGAYNPSTGGFTAPYSGDYLFIAMATQNNVANADNQYFSINVHTGIVANSGRIVRTYFNAKSGAPTDDGILSIILHLNAGETVSIQSTCNLGASRNLDTDATRCRLSIVRMS